MTAAPLATVFGWTQFTSEEGPPIACEGTSLVGAFGCSGAYCDNVRLYCRTTGLTAQNSYWTSYFSEETGGAGNYRFCTSRHWLVGLACSGSYCDNISIQCRYFPGISHTDCHWTGWMSEEAGGTLQFGAGYYARGMQCGGSYCDNKRFYVCKV